MKRGARVRRCLFGYRAANVRNPGRDVNSGASDRLLHSDRLFGRNAQIAAIRRWRGNRGSARARALIGLISL